MSNPYKDKGNVRFFSKEADSEELVWHFDLEDREIIVSSGDWLFQFDGKLPQKLSKGSRVFIKKGQWHRLIKGENDLYLIIKRI